MLPLPRFCSDLIRQQTVRKPPPSVTTPKTPKLADKKDRHALRLFAQRRPGNRPPAVGLALLVKLASEAVVSGPADDALLVEGGDNAVRLLLDEGDAVAVVGEVYERPLELLTAVLLLEDVGTRHGKGGTFIDSTSTENRC